MTPSTDFAIDPRTTNCDSDLRLEWPPAKIHLFGPLAPGMELRQPLPITIQQDPAAGFLASDEIFGVYGAGATWDAAQADYLDAFLEFHELLSSAADLPSRALLEHLETYLRRV